MSIAHISFATFIGGLVCVSVAGAEPRPWMAQVDADALAYYTSLDDNCGPSRWDLDDIVTDIFTDATIAPIPLVSTQAADLFLRVGLHCLGGVRDAVELQSSRDERIFLLDVQFGTARFDDIIVDYLDQYGSIGRRDYVALKRTIESAVEHAVADYAEAQMLYAPRAPGSRRGDAHAERGPLVVHDNPDSLAYRASLDDNCRPDQLGLSEIVSDVFADAAIAPRPIASEESADVFLHVDLRCLERDRGRVLLRGGRDVRIYSLNVRFATSRFDDVVVEYLDQYGSFGLQDLLGMKDAVRSALEDAVADYVAAQKSDGSRAEN